MTSKNLQFEAPPQLAIAHGDVSPVPLGSAYGSLVWSTTEGRLLGWNGTQWSAVAFGANVGGAPSAGRVPLLNASGQVDASCLPSAGSSPVAELDLTPQATPISALAPAYAKLYGRSFGGRIIPVVVPASNLSAPTDNPQALAPHAMTCVSAKMMPTTDPWSFGGGTQTGADPVADSADYGLMTGYRRLNTTTAAANNAYAMFSGVYNFAQSSPSYRYVYRSASPRRGGFLLIGRFALNSLPAPAMFWFNVAQVQANNFTTQGSTGNFSTACNHHVGFVWESADTELNVMCRGGTAAVTKVQCAPAGVFARTNARMAFELGLYSPPGGSAIGWWAQRIDGTPSVAYSGLLTTNLPTGGMLFNWMVNTGPTAPAAARSMDFLNGYYETPDGLVP